MTVLIKSSNNRATVNSRKKTGNKKIRWKRKITKLIR